MDSTSNRTPIDLNTNGEDIDFTGWTQLDKNVYELWLSPCKTWLVQWYNWENQPHWRNRRTAFEQDVYIMERFFYRGDLRWCPRVRGFKNWDFQIIHDFTGCEWLGNVTDPDPVIPEIIKDTRAQNISWPTVSNRNLYRTSEGLTCAFGAFFCFEDSAQPTNLSFWGEFLTNEQRDEIADLPRVDGHYLDWRSWVAKKFDNC